jgi:stage II sporulation protein R
MDGFYMKKVLLLTMVIVLAWFGTVIADREKLSRELIGIQVMADTDDLQAQRLKQEVCDAVMAYLETDIAEMSNNSKAKQYLLANLADIRNMTDFLLAETGSMLSTKVSLTQEAFQENQSGEYIIPSGVYDTLRIVIGKGQGQNCWDVIFPNALYYGNFSGELKAALSGSGEILRFHVLDVLGKIENFFYCQ